MHLYTILAFAVLFWRADSLGEWRLLPTDDVWGTLLIVVGQPLLLCVAGVSAAKHARSLHDKHPDAPHIAQQFHHRSLLFLRIGLFVGFAAALLLTPWPEWFDFGHITPALQIVGDLIVLSPYFVGALVLWIAAYPAERALRLVGHPQSYGGPPADGYGWRMGAYLDFNLRHHLLVVAAPMMLILFAANMTRGYGAPLRRWSGWVWTPDVLLAVVAGGVFVVAPLLLCRIWRTAPLEQGPLRERLEAICRRIGLRCRDILIWKSDGMMINAAVMGVFAPVRYVLLSDALLATMSPRQIEAVFGHEAGHVRHRHIQHFLVFALVGWLAVAGLMEGLTRVSMGSSAWWGLSSISIQALGLAATVLFWGLGFGWVSRCFERQADLFGARCVTPPNAECDRPCSLHLDAQTPGSDGGPGPLDLGQPIIYAVCATALEGGPGPSDLGQSMIYAPGEGGPGPSDLGEPMIDAACATAPRAVGESPRSKAPGELGGQTPCRADGRVCSTAAAIFASALQRVAILNGIPPEERSWRHSSIGSRIRFLISLAGDPAKARAFERLIRRIKTTLLAAALLGAAFFVYYWTVVPKPALLIVR